MNYETVALGDVCEFLDNQRVPITESDRKPGPYPYYGANGQQDSVDSYIFDEPLVLLAEDGGYFGSKDRPIAYKVTGKCWVNNHAHVLRPKSDIDVDYLHRVLSYYDVTKYVNGTTRQKLTKGNAENISFPLPPLTEQKRIASLLARADRLRQLRRTAHDLGDALLQSVFLEMFGDGKWERTSLGEICSLIRDGTHVTPTYVPSGIPFVTVKNITSGHLDFSLTKFISEEEHKKISKGMKPERGDILVSKDGTIGIPCPVDTDKEFSIFVSVALLKPIREKVNTNFLVYQIGSKVVQDQIEDSTKGIAIRHLHLEDFKRLKVILPPLSLQEEFAGVVARVESLRGRMGESERQVEGLFESLLAEAFS